MADWPETEEELQENEDQTATESPPQNSLIWFIAGCLTTMLFLIVFSLGWIMGERGLFQKKQAVGMDQKEASVLTDKDTLAKLDEVQTLIEQEYLNRVDGNLLSTCLFKGVAAGLEDPYASYYSEEEIQKVRESNQGIYFGIGIVLSQDKESGKLTVLEVYKDSPADEAGMLPEDELLSIDGERLEGVPLNDIVAEIKGKEGETVFQIFRPDTEEIMELAIRCANVELDYVEAEMKTDTIGYLRLTEFTLTAAEQYVEALQSLKEQGMEKLIVDIRNNPGGVLDAVCDILDVMLPEGLIVYTENRDGSRKEYTSDNSQLWDGIVAVLVNGYSASASEIFAGAIQDYGLGPVIGTQTYGKGVVQKTFTLSDGSAFKFTAEKYFTAGGQDIDGNGIQPDIEVSEEIENKEKIKTAEDIEAADEILLADETENAEDYKDTALINDAAETEDTADIEDPVLRKAMEVLLQNDR